MQWRSTGRNLKYREWGATQAGPAHLFELRQGPHRVLVSDFGVTVTSWFVDDTDIVLGFDEVGDYERHSPYFGCIVGRYANRIAHGRFCLDGQAYELATNNAPGDMPCHLHGGPEGFHRRLWDAQPQGGEEPSVVFSRVSPNGEEGYPGNLEVRVAVQLRRDGGLRFTTWAKTDRATPFSLTHHGYFNLAGSETIHGHTLQVWADAYLPTNAGLIPSGVRQPVEGTPFDLRRPRTLGEFSPESHPDLRLAGGLDHNFVLSGAGRVAVLTEAKTGRTLELMTDLPGLQVYAGQQLAVPVPGKAGRVYSAGSGVCLEPQHFPDAPNQPGFPDAILRPGVPRTSFFEYRPGRT